MYAYWVESQCFIYTIILIYIYGHVFVMHHVSEDTIEHFYYFVY